jgi:digeranylgeranylglycerophospholipid reductase
LSISDHSAIIQLAGAREIEAKIVIGADGPTSMVARETGLHRRWSSKEITPCRVAEVPASESEILNIYTSDLEYHFFANLGGMPGYGWIFPKRETINIGLGVVGTHSAGLPTRFKVFTTYLMKKGLLPRDADISKAKGALVPTGGPIANTVSDRCLLVGDSAGMVSPLTGGGIAYAMQAGRIAAKVIGEALGNGNTSQNALAAYQKSWRAKFGDELSKQLLAQRIFTGPFTDILFEIGRRDAKIQRMVSEAMAEGSENSIDVTRLLARTLMVCLRGAFRL